MVGGVAGRPSVGAPSMAVRALHAGGGWAPWPRKRSSSLPLANLTSTVGPPTRPPRCAQWLPTMCRWGLLHHRAARAPPPPPPPPLPQEYLRALGEVDATDAAPGGVSQGTHSASLEAEGDAGAPKKKKRDKGEASDKKKKKKKREVAPEPAADGGNASTKKHKAS